MTAAYAEATGKRPNLNCSNSPVVTSTTILPYSRGMVHCHFHYYLSVRCQRTARTKEPIHQHIRLVTGILGDVLVFTALGMDTFEHLSAFTSAILSNRGVRWRLKFEPCIGTLDAARSGNRDWSSSIISKCCWVKQRFVRTSWT